MPLGAPPTLSTHPTHLHTLTRALSPSYFRQVFVQLIAHFKDHLKAEIEVFITKIFLRILESENSPFHHKSVVLDVFRRMCEDPQALVEIFLNYDAGENALPSTLAGLSCTPPPPSPVRPSSCGFGPPPAPCPGLPPVQDLRHGLSPPII